MINPYKRDYADHEKALVEDIRKMQAELKLIRSLKGEDVPVPADETACFYYFIGRAIFRRRTLLGKSQKALGEAIGLSRSTIARIERGERQTLLHVYIFIAHELKITISNLMDRAADMQGELIEREAIANGQG